MFFLKSFFVLFSFTFFNLTNHAFAAETALSGATTSLAKEKIEKPIEDLDQEVQDIKLRANSGAKSKYSTSLYFTYLGASLSDPGGDERPNVGKSKNPSPVRVSGNAGLRYRMNKNESFYAATGFSQSRPFHRKENSQANEELDINTPHIVYNETSAIEDWQLSSGIRLYFHTLEYERAIGQVATLGYSLTSLNRIGLSRFEGGVTLSATATAFDESSARLRQIQSDYSLSLTPSLQYNKTGRVNFYTSLNLVNYSHFRSEQAFRFEAGTITQTIGLGFAAIRDFYISPYLSFEPEQLDSDKTAVNLNATINL